MAVSIYLLASYVFHIRVLEVKWSDESHIFTFNAGMYWIHKSPHAFRLVHWSALHQVCYHAKSTVTDLVGSISFVCVYQSRLPEKVKTPVHIQVWSWDLFSNFLTSVFDSALGITFIHAGILKEKGGIALSDSCGINEILNYFLSGFSFSKCMRPKPFTVLQSLNTHFSMNYHFRIIECICKWKNLQIFPWCDSVELHSFNILMFQFQIKVKRRLSFNLEVE